MSELFYTPGRFVWHELITADEDAALRFYGELCGLTREVIELDPGQPYPVLARNGQPVAGLVQRRGPHVPPHVLGYVSVLDVDGTLSTARELGAVVLRGPFELAAGCTAVLQDPYGAAVGVWRAAKGDPPEVTAPALGSFCWDQHNTSDADGAAAFYARVFGWRASDFPGAPDLRLMLRGPRQAASILQAAQGTFGHWLGYLVVDRLERARERVKTLGGQVLRPEVQVGELGRFALIQDNQGALLAIFEPAGGAGAIAS